MSRVDDYKAAAHAMQSGVAMKMNYDPGGETSRKHLRVGVNSAMCDIAALATLLLRKGVIGRAEYEDAVATAMEEEVARYEAWLHEHVGRGTRVQLR